MSVVYAVSPNYLRALYEESKGFKFRLQGYGDFKIAKSSLIKTNSKDILGFVVFMNRLPSDTSYLEKFINSCNMISTNKKKFLFVLHSINGLDNLLRRCSVKNLKISYITNFEVVTDTFIKRDIYGTILTDISSPYDNKKSEHLDYGTYTVKSEIKYIPLFNSYLIKAIEDVIISDNVGTAIHDDLYLQELRQVNDILYELRLRYIHAHYGINYTNSVNLEEVISNVSSPQEFANYTAILNIIKEVLKMRGEYE